MDELGDAVEEDILLRVGLRLLMSSSGCPLVTAISGIHHKARRDSRSLSSHSGSLCVICKSVSVRGSLLVLSAFWRSINVRFAICLDISQH